MSWLHIINAFLQALTGVVTYLFVARTVGRPKPTKAPPPAEPPKLSTAEAMKRLEKSAPEKPGSAAPPPQEPESEEDEERERLTLASWTIICIAVVSLGITLRIGKIDAKEKKDLDDFLATLGANDDEILKRLDRLIYAFGNVVKGLGFSFTVNRVENKTTIVIEGKDQPPNGKQPPPIPRGGGGEPGGGGVRDGVAGPGPFPEPKPSGGITTTEPTAGTKISSTPPSTGGGAAGGAPTTGQGNANSDMKPMPPKAPPKPMYDYNVLSAMAFPKNDKIELVGDSILQWHVGDDLIVELKPDHPEWFYWTQAKADPALPNKKIFKLSVKADIPNGPRPKPGTAYDVFSTSSGRPFLLRYSDSKSERLATRYHVYYPENHGELVLVEIAPENPGQR